MTNYLSGQVATRVYLCKRALAVGREGAGVLTFCIPIAVIFTIDRARRWGGAWGICVWLPLKRFVIGDVAPLGHPSNTKSAGYHGSGHIFRTIQPTPINVSIRR